MSFGATGATGLLEAVIVALRGPAKLPACRPPVVSHYRRERAQTFVVSSIEGTFGLAKNARSAPLLRENFEVLKEFLETLRAPRAARTARR